MGGPQRQPGALRRKGWRPPPIDPSMAPLLDAIVASRGGSKSHHIMMALTLYATAQEAEAAGLVEE